MILEKIEAQAEQLLKQFGIEETPTPIEEIADALNIKISKAASTEFSGMLIRKDGHALIGVNSSEAPVRQRFTIAHEIAHFKLHPQKSAFVDYRKEKTKIRTSKERHADMFAAALLMPREKLLKDFKQLAKDGFSESMTGILAKRYAVSDDAMRIRLINLSGFAH